MIEFYHIMIRPSAKNRLANDAKIAAKMNLALDWFRLDESNWIVYTSSDKDKWYSRLVNLVKPNGHLLIMKVDPRVRNGWMPKKFWSWVSKFK